MDSSTRVPRPAQGRKFMKYAARAALGAVVMYAVLGHGSMTTGRDIQARDASNIEPNPTYWSTPSTPEATLSPYHVENANKAAAPIPDEKMKMGDDADVEAFLNELFAEEEISQEDKPDHPPPPAQNVPTEEEKAEQQRQKEINTKLKRDDITRRHAKWEKRLQEAAQEEEEELLEKVRKMRMEVVDTMRTNPEMFQLLKKMQVEGLKHTEILEKYLQKMQNDGDTTEDTADIWKQIVDRVSRKLDDKTIETTTYLHNWHAEIVQKEKAVFDASARMLEDIANEAQADLGMEYAWLDDVSTHDWTRYHKLKDDAKKWAAIYETIFNSSHPDMPEDILVTELRQVQTAMARVAEDLKDALDKVKEKGDLWLRGKPEKKAVPSDSSSTTTSEVPVPEHVGETSTPSVQHEEL